ncbi:hypothetical protein PILCRDRAFT_91706 [Piloderma croceum F 1598]|uniref:Protein kinase domain-containing protein n=1 Tax=Piloderma croceum (strain F 1598) TaxID=765440 RepID=A0A0C3AQK2_PILCF|nr:hypothetical protein PILCRDRAFT_91706 [Piloderma croceum F 1598]
MAADSRLPAVDIQTVLNLEDWDHVSFWSSYSNFFKEQGYTLFNLKTTSWGMFPFKQHIMYAQDERKRDIVIKLVQTDSVEHRIHQCLMSYTEFNHSESFPFITPTLEILPSPHNFLFVIMQRWGAAPRVPDFWNVCELLSFIVNILQDIDFGNILINQFTHDSTCGIWDLEARAHLRTEGQACYCLFDFDLSQIFLLDTPITECRLPITSVKERGAPWLHPNEVNGAEQDLDPFKFDVACMGNMLSNYDILMWTNDLQCMIPVLPLLAPLLDRMTTDDVANHFTAFQALSFCQFIQNSLTPMELDKQLPPWPRSLDIDTQCGVWELLPMNFIIKWSIRGQGWVQLEAGDIYEELRNADNEADMTKLCGETRLENAEATFYQHRAWALNTHGSR